MTASDFVHRTFRAANMTDALEDIQRALGPDALVVSVRQVPAGAVWEVWRKPEVEVVAMAQKTAGAAPKAEAAPATTSATPTAEAQARAKDLAADFAQVKSTLSEVASRLDRFTLADWSAPLGSLYRRLLAQELDDELARRVVTACTETLNPRALENEGLVREQVQRQLEAALAEQANGAAARLVCVIGTSGAGKTATVAKLAAYYAKAHGRRAAWICADTFRAGAIAQARIYAEALKMPLRVAYTPSELAQAVEAEQEADLILVDTPAYNPRRPATVVELGGLLTAVPAAVRTTYLALPATGKTSDALEALAACKPFDLSGLVLTKLDETRTFGSLFNVAWRSGLPLAYFTTGPEAHGNLQPGQGRLLVNALFGEGLAR